MAINEEDYSTERNTPKFDFLMEDYSGLSAKIVEEVGFKGIWASGLSITALMGKNFTAP